MHQGLKEAGFVGGERVDLVSLRREPNGSTAGPVRRSGSPAGRQWRGLIFEDPLIYSVRGRVADLATRFRLPAMYVYKDSVEAGGLMAYGPDRRRIYRRAAEYVDKILKGTKPSDLAVEQPTQFTFIINLKAARALGIEVPPTLHALADEVIE